MSATVPLRVCVVAEFYPRADDPVLGVWAHRQAQAVREAGAEVHVLVLYRPVPPRATRPSALWRTLRTLRAQPRETQIDGIPVTYVRFYSPPRGRSYGSWGRYAAWPLRRALRRLRRRFPYDVLHAHNAVPAGDAVRRALAGTGSGPGNRAGTPLVVSVHGGDVYHTAPRSPAGKAAVRGAFAAAALVLANSAGTAARCRALSATRVRTVRLGTDLPDDDALRRWEAARWWGPSSGGQTPAPGDGTPTPTGPTLVTVGHLVARKRHADVLRAIAALRERHPTLRYRVVGDGPERPALTRLAGELGIGERVQWLGQLPHAEALQAARSADLFVLPSTDEAFGVAYVEAMAAAMPAVACADEPGPQEIASAGEGIVLVPPRDVPALTDALDALLTDADRRRALGHAARRTVAEAFTWERCGFETLRAYRDVLAEAPPAASAAGAPTHRRAE